MEHRIHCGKRLSLPLISLLQYSLQFEFSDFPVTVRDRSKHLRKVFIGEFSLSVMNKVLQFHYETSQEYNVRYRKFFQIGVPCVISPMDNSLLPRRTKLELRIRSRRIRYHYYLPLRPLISLRFSSFVLSSTFCSDSFLWDMT